MADGKAWSVARLETVADVRRSRLELLLKVLAVDGGAGGWSIVHKGPGGEVVELNNEMHFELPEAALAFVKELIELMPPQEPAA